MHVELRRAGDQSRRATRAGDNLTCSSSSMLHGTLVYVPLLPSSEGPPAIVHIARETRALLSRGRLHHSPCTLVWTPLWHGRHYGIAI